MTSSNSAGDGPTGYIVLAAYSPNTELFRRQVTSIQAQTVRSFRCIVSADGGVAEIEGLLREIVGDDDRFFVAGHENRVGFYSNFERGLAAVPETADWVALADQDDYWYEDKLERLLPHLKSTALVSGQARVVRYPESEIIAASTQRRDGAVEAVLLDNQFTGSQLVFRRAVLDVALPFPHLRTASEVHDHWLALVAHFVGGAMVIDDVVQDYVQHGGNVIGEAGGGFNPLSSLRTAMKLAEKYESGRSPRALRDATFKVSVGWREVVVETLHRRLPPSKELGRLQTLFGRRRRSIRTLATVIDLARRSAISRRSAIEYLVGTAAGGVGTLRRSFSRMISESVEPASRPRAPRDLS
ncbi:glycosyltransferase [Microbacterium sp.]|uniref:glycosyltransferase n=1 Tax=Microbacterium sp. TaxID=51671 RepID=UPI003242F63E